MFLRHVIESDKLGDNRVDVRYRFGGKEGTSLNVPYVRLALLHDVLEYGVKA